MSIIFADFPSGQGGLYGTNISSAYNGIWTADGLGFGEDFSLVEDPDPNTSGNVFFISTFNLLRPLLRISHPAGAQASCGIGFRLWVDRLPSADTAGQALWSFKTLTNTDIVYCKLRPDGSISAYNSVGTILGTTATPVIAPNSYNHIETKVLRHASTGTVEVRVNGIVKLALTGLALGATNISIVGLGCEVGNGSSGVVDTNNYYKDFIFWDTNGSVGNDFQGSVAVRDLYTDADIDLNWTPSTGLTGWDLLDKTAVSDATYIQAGDPPPDAAVFSLTDLPADVTSVRALIPICRSVKTDGGDCKLQVGLTPNNVDWDDGADNPITTAYTFRWDVSELSPDTAAPWTVTEVNDAYVRIDRTL